MVVNKQKMKVNNADIVFISFLALVVFLAGWVIFGLSLAILIVFLVLVVGVVRLRRTASVQKLNKEKELYQETLFRK